MQRVESATPAEILEGSLRWPMPGYFFRDEQSEFSGVLWLLHSFEDQPQVESPAGYSGDALSLFQFAYTE